MSIFIHFRCDRVLPPRVVAELDTLARDLGDCVDISAASHSDWRKVLGILTDSGISLATTTLSFADAGFHDWGRPSHEWIGAALDCQGGQVGANSPEDFVPRRRPP